MNRKLKLEELNRVSVEEFKQIDKTPVVVLLDDIRSMHNVGSVFRTCDAFAVQKIYLCGITATPPHKEIRKSAIGATESVNWEYSKDIITVIQQLKEEDYTIISIEQTSNSTSLENFTVDIDKKYAIIFGNEVNGVNQEVINLSDLTIELPQSGTKHSLNISVCSGIVLWSFYSEFLKK